MHVWLVPKANCARARVRTDERNRRDAFKHTSIQEFLPCCPVLPRARLGDWRAYNILHTGVYIGSLATPQHVMRTADAVICGCHASQAVKACAVVIWQPLAWMVCERPMQGWRAKVASQHDFRALDELAIAKLHVACLHAIPPLSLIHI